MNDPRHVFRFVSKFLGVLCFLGFLANLNAASVGLAAGSPEVSIPFHDERRATIAVDVVIENGSEKATKLFVEIVVKDAEGNEVTSAEAGLDVAARAQRATEQWMNPRRPQLWTAEKPYLYTVHTTILIGTDVVDSAESSLGVGSDAHAGK